MDGSIPRYLIWNSAMGWLRLDFQMKVIFPDHVVTTEDTAKCPRHGLYHPVVEFISIDFINHTIRLFCYCGDCAEIAEALNETLKGLYYDIEMKSWIHDSTVTEPIDN